LDFPHHSCFYLLWCPILEQPLVSPFPDERDPEIIELAPSDPEGLGQEKGWD
jgi:hypothetical protein